MRLYIHCCIDGRDHVKEVHNITLREGYIPTIGQGHSTATMKKSSPLDPEFTPAVCKKNRGPSTTWHVDLIPLEPALWFKVNIVDVIVVDCKDRCVRWNTVSTTEENLISSLDLEEANLGEHFRGLSMAVLNSGDCYDYEADLDQLIENSQSLMSDYIKESLENKKFNEIVLKLLHCHVLPIIALSTDDIPKLKETLAAQKEWIKKVDNDILNTNQKLDSVQGAINKQCEQWINELKETKKSYPPDFAKVLKSDLDYSIQLAQDNLNELQSEVEKIKSRVSDNAVILEEKRGVRDQARETYENMVKAREHLQELLHSAKRGLFKWSQKGSTEVTLQKIYVGMDAERKKFLNDILMLSHRKVLLLSVREAINWTMDEIETHGASFGLDSDGTGRKSFDVLRHSVIPIDWKPMSEQVYSTVKDKDTDIGKEHNKMVKKVMDQVNRAFYEAELQESSIEEKRKAFAVENKMYNLLHGHPGEKVQETPKTKQKESGSLLWSEGFVDSGEFVFVQDPSTNYHKERCEQLKHEINTHFVNMCNQLQAMLGHHSKNAHKKLWLLYEPYFFSDTMKHLQKLYKKAYGDCCKQLKSFMQKLTVHELQLDNNFILHILEDQQSEQEGRVSVASSSDRSTGSYSASPEMTFPCSPLRAARLSSNRSSILREVNINYPVNLTYVNRSTWPMLELGADDSGCDSSTDTQSDQESTSSTLVSNEQKSIFLQPKYKEQFKNALSCLDLLVKQSTPMTKLQCLTRCLKEVTSAIAGIQLEESGNEMLLGCDDLMDMLVILICNCDLDVLTAVFVDLKLLGDLAAPFLENGPHNYSLVNFIVAFKFIQDRMLVLRRRHPESLKKKSI